MQILCQVCGAKIESDQSGREYAVCEYCGSKSYYPQIREEYVINLFNRANRERLNKNFDDALNAYEAILSEAHTDAAAYWGAFLCIYGVEYVEDTKTNSRVPTIHRMSEEPVCKERHYLLALSNASKEARAQYESEALKIAQVQEKYYRICATEKPYDVFISYKETEGQGKNVRTQDSVYAQKLYEGLKREGYHVFFSRVSLVEKAGDSYEPIIFSALNSAKVMLLVGTRIDYILSPWVRNEWKRYLYIMRTQSNNRLIVAYRDFDIFDLPEELNSIGISNVDLSENGAAEELVRNVIKLLGPKGNLHYDVDVLLDRMMIDIACDDFAEADALADKILEIDSSCPKAYIGKVMCILRVKSEDELASMDRSSWPNEAKSHWSKSEAFTEIRIAEEADRKEKEAQTQKKRHVRRKNYK